MAVMLIPLAILGYNLLTAMADDRLVDILHEAANLDIILLAGTGARFVGGVNNVSRAGFSVYSAGGVSVALGKTFAKARIFEPVFAPGRITGRGIAVRVANSYSDIMAICIYFPPAPWKKQQHVAYIYIYIFIEKLFDY